MTDAEIQEEEREALLSIYDGDLAFKQMNSTTFQYKFGEDNDDKSFLVEIKWGDTYPTDKPIVNMDTFYNKHLKQSLKEKIIELALIEAEQYLGMSMTYSLFEYIKEKFDELILLQTINNEIVSDGNTFKSDLKDLTICEDQEYIKTKLPKKEQLSKAQKRRQWDKVNDKGERPRGWDWVDIVKHLSQTGTKDEQMLSSVS